MQLKIETCGYQQARSIYSLVVSVQPPNGVVPGLLPIFFKQILLTSASLAPSPESCLVLLSLEPLEGLSKTGGEREKRLQST
jgi:hypothetical protein